MHPWQPDSPVQLLDGSWGFELQELGISGFCAVDYSFMQDSDIEDHENVDSDSDSDSNNGEDDDNHQSDFDRVVAAARPAADKMIPSFPTSLGGSIGRYQDGHQHSQDHAFRPTELHLQSSVTFPSFLCLI